MQAKTNNRQLRVQARFKSSAINGCWLSPAQCFGPRQDLWLYFCLFKTSMCFEIGSPLRREEGSDYYPSVMATDFSGTHSLSLTLSRKPLIYMTMVQLAGSVTQRSLRCSPHSNWFAHSQRYRSSLFLYPHTPFPNSAFISWRWRQ
jgi:hypothetical protein